MYGNRCYGNIPSGVFPIILGACGVGAFSVLMYGTKSAVDSDADNFDNLSTVYTKTDSVSMVDELIPYGG